jgi:hypothetical protein
MCPFKVFFYFIVVGLCFFWVMDSGFCLAEESDMGSYIRWEYKPPLKQRNGTSYIEPMLLSSNGDAISEGFYYYKATEFSSFRGGDIKAEPRIVKGFFKEGENTFSIESGAFTFIELMGTAILDGKRQYAQCGFMLLGETRFYDPIKATSGPEPIWPSFIFMGSGEMYWPQIGHTFTLIPKGETKIGDYKAFNKDGLANGEYVNTGNGIGFIPGTDKELNDLGSQASKPLFFVAKTSDGGNLSYTIYIHRNRFQGENINLGLMVFFMSFGITSFILVIFFMQKRKVLRHVTSEL